MAKRLFLLLFIGLEWILFGADFLSASDTVLTNTPGYDAVETVIEPAKEEPIVEQPSSEPVAVEPVYVAPVVTPVAPVAPMVVAPMNFTVTSVTDQIVEWPSYYDIYRTGKFLYAHNSSGLFGSIVNLNPGDIFTITEGGIVRTYRVMDKQVYAKAENGYLEGSRSFTKAVEINANGYDISMMTCYGTMYGNGDASHRLVLFANAV